MSERVIEQLDAAYSHIYRHKIRAGFNNDIWQLSYDWRQQKSAIADLLRTESYHFSPVRSVEYKPNKYLHTFRTIDALVLKALALGLNGCLPSSALCHSYKGHGGVKQALIRANVKNGSHILKTDVQDYYASIDHFLLLEQLSDYITPDLLRLVYNALKCLNTRFDPIEKGLPRGSALSHALGNFYLHESG